MRTPTEIKVYWDIQGEPEDWAYVAYDYDGAIESGGCGAIERNATTLEQAIEEACSILCVDIPVSHFAISRDDGGWAIWTKNRHLTL